MHRPHLIAPLLLLALGCLSPPQDNPILYFDAEVRDARPSPEVPDGGLPPPEALKIASYNLERMFYPYPETWSLKNYHARIEDFGEILASINADVIGLTEIDDYRVLVDLAEATRRAGGPDYIDAALAPGREASGGLDVGLLSRYPIVLKRSRAITWPYDCVNSFGPIHLDEEIPFARPILQAHLDLTLNGLTDMVIFVNHWKSKAPPSAYRCVDTEDDRRRAALQLRDLFDQWFEQNPRMPLIALGDFNCEELEAPLREDMRATLLPEEISSGDQILNSWGLRMDVQMRRYVLDNSSYNYRGGWNRIDHILLSGHFRPNGEAGYVPTGIGPFHTRAMLRNGVPYRQPDGYSDHLPVVLELSRE